MITYSIIIPHKDSLSLLSRCINSLPIRNDIQVIIVDDNSNIGGEIWNKFLLDNKNIELYLTKEGKGAGYARNIGLAHAKGKWVIFADADDFFYDNAFEILDTYSNSYFDVLYFICDSRDGESLILINDRVPIIRQSIVKMDYNSLRYNSSVPWGKMINRKTIEDNHLYFDEVEVSNDIIFSINLGLVSPNVGVINNILYCCTRNSGSLFFNNNVRRLIKRIQVTKKANNLLHDNNLDIYRLSFPTHSFNYVRLFFPKHPFLFIWGIWKSRYKGASLEYIRDLYAIAKIALCYRMKSLFKR